MAFWKPGEARPSGSYPLSAEVDRGGVGDSGRLLVYNRDDGLALATQRRRLPIFNWSGVTNTSIVNQNIYFSFFYFNMIY